MIRNKVVWDKHYNSNRLTVRICYSRFRLMCIFKQFQAFLDTSTDMYQCFHNKREDGIYVICA